MLQFDENNNVIDNEMPRAILVGVSLGEDISYSMQELQGLAEADNIEVIAHIVQNSEKINAGIYIGTGKLHELAEMCSNMDADLVVFNDELSGMQLRNLEDECGVKVIDRTILILDIFAKRAVSAEGRLQVEFAQLSYRMPRLTGFGKSLSRLGGGIGTRGPGESKLESDRRHIETRMDEIKASIKRLETVRKVQRSRREKSDIPVVALVGYTNSGKSSLMNALLSMEQREDKHVFEKDMLFATLDTSQRLITLDDRHSFILTDTVGFVSKLPHSLISAFKSTLEEALNADLLIQVIDASYENKDFYVKVTESVLNELHAGEKPMIMAFNKCDLVPNLTDVIGYGSESVLISAKTGAGLENLIGMIKARLFSDTELVRLLIPYSKGDILSLIMSKNKPFEILYLEAGTEISIELNKADLNRFSEYIVND